MADQHRFTLTVAGDDGRDRKINYVFDVQGFNKFISHPGGGVKTITLPDTISEYDLAQIDFAECASLHTVDLSGTQITQIPSGIFKDCTSLKTAVFPDTLERIYGNAFAGTALKTAIFPAGLKYIFHKAFDSCQSLETVDLSKTLVARIPSNAFNSCTSLETVVFPAGLEMFYHHAFQSCASLKAVDLSGTRVFGIGAGTFRLCTSIETVSFPAELNALDVQAFDGCAALGAVDLSGTRVSRIDEQVFRRCTSLVTVDFPASLDVIGGQAFSWCAALGAVDLSGTQVAGIGDQAFRGCTSLETVVFPDTLKWIEDETFDGCTALGAVKLSKTQVTRIGHRAFRGCTSLVTVFFPHTLEEIGNEADEADAADEADEADAADEADEADVTVPDNAMREALVINVSAFENCLLLSAVKFPDRMDPSMGDYIGERAFANCPSLTDVNVDALQQMHLPDEGRGVFPRADGKSLLRITDNDRFWTTALALERRVDNPGSTRDILGIIDTHVNKFTRADYWGPYPKIPRDPKSARFQDKFACHV
jgi:hypothetical protein